MKAVLVELAIWVFWTAMLVSAGWVYPLMADQENETMLGLNTILTFNTEVGTEDSYKSFIQQLRNQLEGSEVENIPVLGNPATVPDNQRFLLVRLQASQEIFVTLVVDVTTLYVLGYGDKYQGKDRAQFFNDAQDTAIPFTIENVFRGANLLVIPYGISYGAMETAAGAQRQRIMLGIKILQSYIKKVFGLPPAQTPTDRKQRNMIEATFLLIAIQMVSEAARSKYIEGVIHQEGQFPDGCVVALELVWTKISEAIQKVGTLNTGDKLDVCPGLKGLTGDALTKAIIDGNYMGILKYKGDGVHI